MYLLKGTAAEWAKTADINTLVACGVLLGAVFLCLFIGMRMVSRDIKELENEQAS